MTAGFYFDPEAEKLKVFLGPVEAELMELAWRQGQLSVKQARFLLADHKDLAYTTVMTVLTRLSDKGLLAREKDGRNFVYRPAVERAAYLRQRVERVRSTLSEQFPEY